MFDVPNQHAMHTYVGVYIKVLFAWEWKWTCTDVSHKEYCSPRFAYNDNVTGAMTFHMNMNIYLLDANFKSVFLLSISEPCRTQWPRRLRHGSAATRLLRLRVLIQPGAIPSVSCECCVCCQVEACVSG
jgi:hypothetical protein